ncbi:hypothetical protein LguiB_009523 [Lonicera macranthoides]
MVPTTLTHGLGTGDSHYAQGAYGGHYDGVGHGHGKVKHGKFKHEKFGGKHNKFGKHKKHGFKKWKSLVLRSQVLAVRYSLIRWSLE